MSCRTLRGMAVSNQYLHDLGLSTRILVGSLEIDGGQNRVTGSKGDKPSVDQLFSFRL
jgi:hypothetical protein